MKSQLFFPFCLVLFSHGATVDPQELSATQVRQFFSPPFLFYWLILQNDNIFTCAPKPCVSMYTIYGPGNNSLLSIPPINLALEVAFPIIDSISDSLCESQS